MSTYGRTFIAAVTVLVVAASAHAQFFYSDPPALMGQGSYRIYSVPGVIANGALDTFFACTNTTPASIRVGVELFGPPGGAAFNDPSASSLDVGSGASVIFGTGAAVGISISSNLGGFSSKGAARILATAKRGIICSAFLADPANAPPISMADLKVVAKAKQHGE